MGVKRRGDPKYDEGKLSQLGTALRNARNARGLSQEALADAAGINRTHIGEVERGKRNVSFLHFCRIADALGRKPSDLLAEVSL
ncbi:anaerobic benzoate catabolism transcriptional regulator [compost metagenome]